MTNTNSNNNARTSFDATVVLDSVTSPARIQSIARNYGVAPAEVFVRISFLMDKERYTFNNKLKYLGKADYKTLLDAAANRTPIHLDFNTDGFFYIHEEVNFDKLFDEPEAVPAEDAKAHALQQANDFLKALSAKK